MEKLSQLVGFVVLVAASYMYFAKTTDTPDVIALRGTGLTSQDADLIAAYIRTYGDMVMEDGSRSAPYIENLSKLKGRMRDVGNLSIGTSWKIGERYPALPGLLAAHFADMDELDRTEFHNKTHALADLLEKV